MVKIDSNELLKLNNIGYSIGGKEILKDITFSIEKNSITAIIGPNGAGKSTILKIIIGSIKPSYGYINKYDNIKIGYAPQVLHIRKSFPITVYEFLDSAINKSIDIHFVFQLLEIESSMLKKYIVELSGGEIKKILFARALISGKELILLDESDDYLDVPSKRYFYQSLERVRLELNCSIVLISHDLFFVMRGTNKTICVNKKICCQGVPSEIEDSVNKAFGLEINSIFKYYKHKEQI